MSPPATTTTIMSSDFTFLARGLVPHDLKYPSHDDHPHDHDDHLLMDTDHLGPPDFELSDYLFLGNGSEDDSTSSIMVGKASMNQISSQNMEYPIHHQLAYNNDAPRSARDMKCKGDHHQHQVKKMRVDVGFRIAFRTKSEQDIMDDGFKWRKYGKKSVKNSPNPRNYYRCSSRGCQVKKRVERDREDSSYVMTTYEGVHNHESPCVVYYNQMPLMVPTGWTLQASHSSS